MPVEFLPTDINEIEARLREAFDQSRDADGRPHFPDQDVPGTPGYDLRTLWARVIARMNRDHNVALTNWAPIRAEGSGLDGWLNLFEMPRNGAGRASGRVLVTSEVTGSALERLLGTRTIPKGTQLIAGAERLVTVDEVAVPESERSVQVAVESLRAGDGIVLRSGTRLRVEIGALRDALTAETVTDITGGRSVETDDQARFRLIRALIDPTTAEGFRGRLLGHEAVSTAELAERVYGPGTIEAFVVPTNFPTPELRTELEAIWQGAGRVYVLFPTYEGAVLQIRVDGDVPAAATDRIVDHVNNLAVGEQLVLSQVENILLESGARDAQVIGLKRGLVNGDGTLAEARRLRQVTNLAATDSRYKWLTKASWITLCEV